MNSARCAIALAAALLLHGFASAQDERRLSSPDGRLEFRLFLASEEERPLVRIAYQVFYRGKPLIETSFLGLDIWSQEPLLGETTGLIGSDAAVHPGWHSMTARYMQNGSLGRLLTIEVRAYNDAIAFRYVVPPSTPLQELLIADEATSFAFTGAPDPGPELPFVTGLPGALWLGITEVAKTGVPRMHLIRPEPGVLLTRLARNALKPEIVYAGTTPWTGPWRVISVGASRAAVENPGVLKQLPSK